MKKLTRREAMGTVITAGAGVMMAGITKTVAQTPAASAFRGQHQPKPLPFDAGKLKGISEKLIKSHWENNYGGAVRALNGVEQRDGGLLELRRTLGQRLGQGGGFQEAEGAPRMQLDEHAAVNRRSRRGARRSRRWPGGTACRRPAPRPTRPGARPACSTTRPRSATDRRRPRCVR